MTIRSGWRWRGRGACRGSAALDAQTKQLMDIDQWMRAYAMITLAGIGDMYTFGNNHNWMTYIRSDNHKAVYFPWDMDFSFTRANNAGLVGDQNFSKIVNLPGNLRCFYAHILDHIDTTYNTAYMNYWLAHYGPFAGQSLHGRRRLHPGARQISRGPPSPAPAAWEHSPWPRRTSR